MAHWAKINENNIVENVIVTDNNLPDEGEAWINANLEGTWLKTSYNTKKGKHIYGGTPFRMNFAQPGSLYIPELDAFTNAKMEGEEDFVLHEPTLTWVPAPVPEDATYAMPYGPEPEWIDGEPQISESDISYVWMAGENQGWWLNPNSNYPKPEGEFYWNGISKEWVAPTSEKPGDNYTFNVFTREWEEFTPPTE